MLIWKTNTCVLIGCCCISYYVKTCFCLICNFYNDIKYFFSLSFCLGCIVLDDSICVHCIVQEDFMSATFHLNIILDKPPLIICIFSFIDSKCSNFQFESVKFLPKLSDSDFTGRKLIAIISLSSHRTVTLQTRIQQLFAARQTPPSIYNFSYNNTSTNNK